MGVTINKCASITNRDVVPEIKNNPQVGNVRITETIGYCAALSGDSIGSTYIFGSIPSNARMSSITLFCTAITSGAANVGLYQTTANGSAVVSVSFFAAAQTIATASYTGLGIVFQSGGLNDLQFAEQPLWLQLGLAADPHLYYDVVATLTAATTAAGKMAMRITYVL